ncbi:MAG: AAA family ATPase [Thermovirga sp.]|nr:AAA family ATPase [Thermovirga sp.]
MSGISTSLAKWFSERPQWLQIAAARLLKQLELTDKDVSELATLCQQEADGKLPETTCSFPSTVFSQGAEGIFRLCSISDVEGINALAPRKPLEFGKGNLTVIYGSNGSGKSGYVRLLKHVCGARETGTLYRNVFKPDSTEQKACISFEQDGILKTHIWSGQGICDDLNCVDIFDNSFGKVFVSIEGEVSYEPPVLSFFSSLILACGKVASALDAEADRLQSKKPNIPADKKVTPEGIWYEAISAKTSTYDIDKHCTFGNLDETEMQTLQQRLAEQSPAEKVNQLRNQKQHIDTLIKDAKKYLAQLSDENYRRIIAAKKKSILKKTAADTAAGKMFSGSELEGIGSDVWKEFWEAARNYSVSAAYKEAEYPNVSDGSRCVLCHQPLTQETKDRLISFEFFVKGEMQKAATDAALEYEDASQTIETLPTSETLKTLIDAAGIQQDDFASQVMEFFAQLQARKDELSGIDSEEAIPDPVLPLKWIEQANIRSKNLSKLAAKYDEDAKSDNREEIKKKIYSLQARKWLSEHRAAIDEEVCRLKSLGLIQMAKTLADTTALSKKKGELAETLITDAFAQRFDTELKTLGARKVNVELVKSRVSKGRVLHKLQLRGASQSGLADVLSEGENRVISIAAFLADVTGKTYPDPLVFDDPISSLDQNYEEAVVQRLCSIASERQVIIFTHRLSFLAMAQDYTRKVDIKPKIICVRKEPWGTGEPGKTPLEAQKPLQALNTLIDSDLPEAEDLFYESGFDAYKTRAMNICIEFRILLERMIEHELMSDVVQRYRRAINTMGKICNLAKISEADCKYFDELMTKYSKYGHSQPPEAPVTIPEPDELREDFDGLREWQKEFKNRPTTSVFQEAK